MTTEFLSPPDLDSLDTTAWRVVGAPADGLLPERVRTVCVAARRSSVDPLTIRVARRVADRFLAPAPRRLTIAHQIHAADVLRVDGAEPVLAPELGLGVALAGRADALWTSRPENALVLRTADCAPVTLWDAGATRVALVHSGWRGTVGDILGETVARMVADGVAPERLSMWIGPSICGRCYEVGDDVREAFASRRPDWSDCWAEGRLDIAAILVRQALEAGLRRESIHESGLCTYCARGAFPSHRREGPRRVHALYNLAFLRGGTAWK